MALHVFNTASTAIVVTDLVTMTTSSLTTIAPVEHDKLLAVFEVVISIVIIVCALFGNLVVVNTLWRKRKTLTRMHFFIYHLCIADIISAIFSQLPLLVTDIKAGEFHGPNILCKFVQYFRLFPIYLSSYILVLTAFDRYLAICHPLLGLRGNQKLRMRTMVAVVWILAAVFALPQMYFFYVKDHDTWGIRVCWVDFSPMMGRAYPTIFTLLIFFIPSVFLIAIYGQICLTVWQNMGKATGHTKLQKYVKTSNESWDREEEKEGLDLKRNGNSHEKGERAVQLSRCHTADARVSRAKLKTIKMTLTIVTVYIVCWTPFFFELMYGVWLGQPLSMWMGTLFQIMANINCCTNPWIYLAFSGNVLGAVRELFCFCKACQTRDHFPVATTTAQGDEPSGRFVQSPAGPRTTYTSSGGTDNKVDTNANSSF